MGRRAGNAHSQPVGERHRVAKNFLRRDSAGAVAAGDHRQKRRERHAGETKRGEGDVDCRLDPERSEGEGSPPR